MQTRQRPTSGVRERAIDVLVVEDDEDARSSLADLLMAHDFLVRTAASADAAHVLALARVPDVVVTDLRLVGGSAGWVLAEALRGGRLTHHVALIAITGEVEPRPEVVSAFDAYLRKPIETQLLISLVRQLSVISRAQRRQSVTPAWG